MLLIYSHHITPRLNYVTDFIFKEQLGISVTLTNSAVEFTGYPGAKINYSKDILDEGFHIPATGLLHETGIRQQKIDAGKYQDELILFPASTSHYSFDLFSAIFYLLSRYEEYLPHNEDSYGRFSHESSIAFKYEFLHKPLINTWIQQFAEALVKYYPFIILNERIFRFIPTYDIDIAYSYKYKGLIRSMGGMLKKPEWERLSVLVNRKKDPYDAYDFIDSLHQRSGVKPVYFFPAAISRGKYDKNIDPNHPQMQRLIQTHHSHYAVGLHPSWISNTHLSVLKLEKDLLEKITGETITRSRQHYIKFSLPKTYQQLIHIGITEDYSMGYGSINGFRASVASSFLWYDLTLEKQTALRIFPFCYMDANSFYEQGETAQEGLEELYFYFEKCRMVNGLFISIFHNNFLGTSNQFIDWRNGYERFIARVQQWL